MGGNASLKLHERWPGPAHNLDRTMQSISRACYKPGTVYTVLCSAVQCSAQCAVCAVCGAQTPPPTAAGLDESSHDAKWGLGDPNLDPDLVSN